MFVALSESPSFEATAGRSNSARASLRRVARIDGDFATTEAATNTMMPRQSIFTRQYVRLNVGASLAFFSISFVAYAVISWSPVFLTTSGFTLAEALRATMAFNIAAVSAALINSFLVDRFGSRTVLLVCGGGILLALGALFLWTDRRADPRRQASGDAWYWSLRGIYRRGPCGGLRLADVFLPIPMPWRGHRLWHDDGAPGSDRDDRFRVVSTRVE